MSAALWPSPAEKAAGHKLGQEKLFLRRDIPAFCNPLVIFFANWVLMLVTLSFSVTNVSYPKAGIPALLFALSLASFFLAYLVSRMLLHRWPASSDSLSYTVDVTCAVAVEPADQCRRGPDYRLQLHLLWPAACDPRSRILPDLRTIQAGAVSAAGYRYGECHARSGAVAQGPVHDLRPLMADALCDARAHHVWRCFRCSLSLPSELAWDRRKLYLILAGFLAFALLVITLFGNARTAQDKFLEYLQIRHKYSGWPMAFLWLTSYVSIPFSNLCWFFAKGHFHGPTLSFLYPLLPSFLAPSDPHASIHNDRSIIDGASTYLAVYALDFSFVGVYLAKRGPWRHVRMVEGTGHAEEHPGGRHSPFLSLLHLLQRHVHSAFDDSSACHPGHGPAQMLSLWEPARFRKWCSNDRDQASVSRVAGASCGHRRYRALSNRAGAVARISKRDGCTRAHECRDRRCSRAPLDNTPSPGSGQNLPQDVAYLASERNSGLATAYNRARRLAAVNRSQWLLTLDQDTAVPLDFFVKDGVGIAGRVPATRASALSFRRSLREQSNSRQIGFSSARSRAGGVADTSAYRLSRCSRSTLERC